MSGPWLAGRRDKSLKRVVLLSFMLLAVQAFAARAAGAEEMKAPQLVVAPVDWNAAAAVLDDPRGGPPDDPFGPLNAATGLPFHGVADSPVPVLLPFDAAAFGMEMAGVTAPSPERIDEIAGHAMQGGFQPSKFFLAGPAGYDATFSLRTAQVRELSDIRYPDPVYVILSGLGMTYELDGPPLPEGTPVKSLEADFPGIRRYLHESYVRYSFQRFGVTYVAAIYCLDRRPRPKILTCKQADRIAERFLRALRLAGGAPSAPRPSADIVLPDRPALAAPDFAYFSPGFLIPGSGLKKDLAGRPDYTVYAQLRFPLKDTPAFANSQSFNNWGDCDFTGRSVRTLRKKGTPYACKVNGLPLVFDESAGANYSYPWRDNFCEHRNFFVGQCPGGEGHQGQDIRPSRCTLFNEGGDRCLPYQHDVVAAHDGMILRAPKQEAAFLFVNTAGTHVRVRYIHMNPNMLDADGILSGKTVRAGDLIGKVATYNHHERGTTYHLHFDMQVPTKLGFVFVNPYASLVAAYERLIGARGTEIKPGDPVPPAASVPPAIAQPAPAPPATAGTPPAQTEEKAAVRVKPHKKARPVRKKKRIKHAEDAPFSPGMTGN
jgi:murein DD-endopeptidase MepM/ murein hydrolase activator NlpD